MTDLRQDIFCALFRPPVFSAVIDIVGEHTPNLGALNLEGNKLQDVSRFSNKLYEKLPNITILYLGNNKVSSFTSSYHVSSLIIIIFLTQIREWRDLDGLKQFKLTELRLAGNPICEKFKTRLDDITR